MTLVEFLAPILKKTNKDKVLAVLYFNQRYKATDSLTVDKIRSELKAARVPKHSNINVPDVLNKSGHYVDSPGLDNAKRLWKLTDSGSIYIRDLLGLPQNEPEIEHDVASLNQILNSIKDDDVKDYIEESIKCLSVNAMRAAVVFLWSGAIREVQNELLKNKNLNTALMKFDPKARNVTKIDHFAYIKDSITLLAACELEVLDKNEKDMLEDALKLRNKSGHPGKYKLGPKKVSSFIEDVVGIVFK